MLYEIINIHFIPVRLSFSEFILSFSEFIHSFSEFILSFSEFIHSIAGSCGLAPESKKKSLSAIMNNSDL